MESKEQILKRLIDKLIEGDDRWLSFDEVVTTQPDAADTILQAMETYAKQQVEEFAKWTKINGWICLLDGFNWQRVYDYKGLTFTELYNEFLTTQNK